MAEVLSVEARAQLYLALEGFLDQIEYLGAYVANRESFGSEIRRVMVQLQNPKATDDQVREIGRFTKRSEGFIAEARLKKARSKTRYFDIEAAHKSWLEMTVTEPYKALTLFSEVEAWLGTMPSRDGRFGQAWVDQGNVLLKALAAPWGNCPDCKGKKTPLYPQKLQSGDWRVPDACGTCKRERRLEAENRRKAEEAEKEEARKLALEAAKQELEDSVKGFVPSTEATAPVPVTCDLFSPPALDGAEVTAPPKRKKKQGTRTKKALAAQEVSA